MPGDTVALVGEIFELIMHYISIILGLFCASDFCALLAACTLQFSGQLSMCAFFWELADTQTLCVTEMHEHIRREKVNVCCSLFSSRLEDPA